MKRLAVIAGVFLAAVPAAQAAGDKPRDCLEGTWELVSVEINQQPLAMDQLKNAKLVVKGEKYSFTLGDTHLEMTHKLLPDKTPKAMDMTVVAGEDKGKTYHAIYQLDGDRLTICRNFHPEMERPTKFATRPDSGLMLVVWKRTKS